MTLDLKNNKLLSSGIIISGVVSAIVLGIVLFFAIAYFKKRARDNDTTQEKDLEEMRKTYKTLESKLKYTDLDGKHKILTAEDVESLPQREIDEELNIFISNEPLVIISNKCTSCTIYIIKKLCMLYFDTSEEKMIYNDGDFKMDSSILRKRFPEATENNEGTISKEVQRDLKGNAMNLIKEYEKSKAEYESAEQAQKKFKTIQPQNKNQTLFQYIKNDMFSNSKPKT